MSPFLRSLLFSVIIFSLFSACQNSIKKEEKVDEVTLEEGKKLSQIYCASCHLYPEPGILDKKSWEKYVLPRMGYMMGHYVTKGEHDSLFEAGLGGDIVRQSNIFPDQPQIPAEQWEKIKAFYLELSPDSLSIPSKSPIKRGLKNFTLQTPQYRLSPPSTTLTHISNSGEIYIGDVHTKSLLHFGKDFQFIKAGNVKEGVSHLRETSDALWLTILGAFSPTDNPSGLILRLPTQRGTAPKIILRNLQRPTHTAYGDLNQDGKEDLVISEFGKWTGGLAWWEQTEKEQYKKHMLRPKSGAIKSMIQDLNGDSLPDIMTLFGQGDEGIFIYYNQGNGSFREEVALRFPASHGSSYFDICDLNGDEYPDIIYTAGDNADFEPILKPYHGIRGFINNGENRFSELFFYPLNGAYKAIPADFDEDGDLDIAAISFFPDFYGKIEEGFVLLENQGDFKFEGSTFEEVDAGRWIVMDSGDIDGDDDIDIVLGSLAFEVIPKGNFVESWVGRGIPFVVLKNTLR